MREKIEYLVELGCETITLTELARTEGIPRNVLRMRYLRGARGDKLIAPIEVHKKQKPRKPKEINNTSSGEDILNKEMKQPAPRRSVSRYDVVTHNNQTHTLWEWAKITGICYETIATRYRNGCEIKDLFIKVNGNWMKNKTLFTYKGKTKTLTEWSSSLYVPLSTLCDRHAKFLAGKWTAHDVVHGKERKVPYNADVAYQDRIARIKIVREFKEKETKKILDKREQMKLRKEEFNARLKDTYTPIATLDVPNELINLIKKLQAPKNYDDIDDVE